MSIIIIDTLMMHYTDRHSQEERSLSKDTRESMVRTAAALIGSRGIAGTSFSDVIGASGAPRGSIYHHFPDGKQQLAEDAIRWTTERVLARQRACAGRAPAEILACFIDLWRQVVLASDGRAGCVVAGVAVDTSPDETALMDVVREAFRSWTALVAGQLTSSGIPGPRAASIALATLAAMEGALILCRAEGDVAPLEAVAGELLRLVE
jgi:AcrR family transcriptional regulator